MLKSKGISARKKVVAIFMLLYILVIIFLPAHVYWENNKGLNKADYGYEIVTINNLGERPSFIGKSTIRNGTFHKDFALPVFLTELAVLTVLFSGTMYLTGDKRKTDGASE